MAYNKAFQNTIDWYNKNALQYSQNTTSHPRNAPLFLSFLPGKKILDAGCGPGYDTSMFSDLGYDVTGIDISDGFLDIAKKKFPILNFVKGNFLNLPFPDKTFDGIWSQASLVHLATIKEVSQALNEFYRVLKLKGILYVKAKKQKGRKKTLIIKDNLSKYGRFFRFFTEKNLINLLTHAGFSIIKSEIQPSSRGKNEGMRIIVLARKK